MVPKRKKIAMYAAMIIITAIVVFPFLWMVLLSFKSSSEIMSNPLAISDYTLSMGASFFKGNYTVDYGGIVASSLMIIVPELIFYGLFQKNIVEGMTAGAVKG